MTPEKLILDVREPDEFNREHVPGSLNIPLSRIHHLDAYKDAITNRPLLILCGTGKRATIAKEHLQSHNLQCEVVEGGIADWKQKGNPVLTFNTKTLSLFRQVQIVVGTAVLILSLMAYFITPIAALIAAFIGMMLALAGLFGFCMLATVLAKMPWNKAK